LIDFNKNYGTAYVCKVTNGTADVKMQHPSREITLMFSGIVISSMAVHRFWPRIASDSDNHLMVCVTDKSIKFVSFDYAIKTVTNTMLRLLSVGNLFNVFATYLRFRRVLAFITCAKTTGSSFIFTDQTERAMFWLFQSTANSMKCEPSCTCLTLHKQNVRNKTKYLSIN